MAIPVVAIVAGAAIGGMVGSILPPVQRAIAYPVNRLWRNEVIGISEALELRLREKLSESDTSYHIGSTGLSAGNIEKLMELKQQLFDVMSLVTLWRREEIADDDLMLKAKHIGWSETDVDLVKQLTEVLPNAQDIIRFAVHEVYAPEVAKQFGRYEENPYGNEDVNKDLKALGMGEKTFNKYWAAHWELPSIQMGFEMMHRGIIDEKVMDMLLFSLDVLPFFRDNIKAIAYNPLTRVDVRRMHKIGVITTDELTRAYMDLGYNAENAQRLTDFTVKYNTDPEAAEKTDEDVAKAKEKDLTKADILGGYKDGMFAVSDVTEALTSLRYSQDEIDYYLSRADFERDKDTTNELLKFYEQAYITGIISFNDTTDALNQLGLDGKYVEALFGVWDLKRQARIQKPTKAEILTFLRKKVIDQETAITELQGLGYQAKYIEWYMQTK